jgi:hypothetical protein
MRHVARVHHARDVTFGPLGNTKATGSRPDYDVLSIIKTSSTIEKIKEVLHCMMIGYLLPMQR